MTLRCLVGVHDDDMQTAPGGRLFVRCAACGRETRGIVVGQLPPAPRLAGRPDRAETVWPQLRAAWHAWVDGERARELGRVV